MKRIIFIAAVLLVTGADLKADLSTWLSTKNMVMGQDLVEWCKDKFFKAVVIDELKKMKAGESIDFSRFTKIYDFALPVKYFVLSLGIFGGAATILYFIRACKRLFLSRSKDQELKAENNLALSILFGLITGGHCVLFRAVDLILENCKDRIKLASTLKSIGFHEVLKNIK